MHTFSVISGYLEEPTWQHCNGRGSSGLIEFMNVSMVASMFDVTIMTEHY